MSEDETDEVTEIEKDIRSRVDEYVAAGRDRRLALELAIVEFVNDPQLAPSVARRVARAANAIDPLRERLYRMLAIAAHKIRSGEARSPAGYFGSSAKRLVVGFGIEWEPRRDR
jgi:hypothetical protein